VRGFVRTHFLPFTRSDRESRTTLHFFNLWNFPLACRGFEALFLLIFDHLSNLFATQFENGHNKRDNFTSLQSHFYRLMDVYIMELPTSFLTLHINAPPFFALPPLEHELYPCEQRATCSN